MSRFDAILVPTDGSEHAVRAAEHAAALADAFDATLHIISVVDLQRPAGPFNAGGLDEDERERYCTAGREQVEATLAAIDTPGDVRTDVRTGKPVAEIRSYATDEAMDLVVMGTQGRTGLDRLVVGSVAAGVVRHASVPVVTTRATERSRLAGAYEDVLVATDGSERSMAAVDPALSLAAAFDARVHAVSVVDVGDMAATAEYSPPTQVLEYLESAGENATEEIAARARDRGLDATTSVVVGRPADELLADAEERDVDLVAMGTAGRTGISRFLLGSTTERVIRHAEMPVLSVNTRERDAK